MYRKYKVIIISLQKNLFISLHNPFKYGTRTCTNYEVFPDIPYCILFRAGECTEGLPDLWEGGAEPPLPQPPQNPPHWPRALLMRPVRGTAHPPQRRAPTQEPCAYQRTSGPVCTVHEIFCQRDVLEEASECAGWGGHYVSCLCFLSCKKILCGGEQGVWQGGSYPKWNGSY